MNSYWRKLVIAATLGGAAATPGAGQDVAPTVGLANSGAPIISSTPDFSGIWAYAYWPGFEPPASGPGPVVNKLRRRQVLDPDGRPLPAASAPLAGNPNLLVGDYSNSILKPHAAEVVKKQGEMELNGGAPTPSNQCWPEPVPYIFRNHGMQMLQQPHQITILYDEDNEVRRVRMNQPHPARVTPSWYGDSVGHYEGDALVIDTVGIKTDRPFAMVDSYGTPYTEALHVAERYRLIDYEAGKHAASENFRFQPTSVWVHPDPGYRGKVLQLEFTVEDEGVFTTPWSATITYRHASGGWAEVVCAENIHEYYAGIETPVLHVDKPDF